MDLPIPTHTPLALRLLADAIPLDLLPDIAWPPSAVGTDFTPTKGSC